METILNRLSLSKRDWKTKKNYPFFLASCELYHFPPCFLIEHQQQLHINTSSHAFPSAIKLFIYYFHQILIKISHIIILKNKTGSFLKLFKTNPHWQSGPHVAAALAFLNSEHTFIFWIEPRAAVQSAPTVLSSTPVQRGAAGFILS